MPYRMRHPQQVADEFEANHEPCAVFIDNNLGSRKDHLRAVCGIEAAQQDLERRGHG